MNKAKLFILLMMFMMLLAYSCKSKKSIAKQQLAIAKPSTKSLLIKKIDEQQNELSYYSSNGKLYYRDDNNKQDLGVSIVMEKGKFVYFNITALLGITVARALVTPDSIVILDMLHRKCIITNYEYIKRMTNAELHLDNIQNLLTGNTLFQNDTGKSIIDSLTNAIEVKQPISFTQMQQTMYASNLKVISSKLIDIKNKQEMNVVYQETHERGASQYPSKFTINIRAEKNIESTFELNNFVFEKKKDIQFIIPKSYETVRM